MKKFLLFGAALVITNAVSAQFFYFNGSTYKQNFDNISTGTPGSPNLPVEWTLYTDATPSALGTPRTLLSSSKGTKYHWRNTTGGFKDVASADGFTSTTDSATQMGATDRALAVRQVSTSNANFGGSDPGAAFVLRVSNTKNLSQFTFSFKLQSLDDTSHRQTEWVFEYGLGDNPTSFTQITTSPATLQTGGDVFSNTTVTGTIPAAIDNSSVPVYFRIRSASAAQPVPPNNGGNRATTAIDDFELHWTGNATGVQDVEVKNMELKVLGAPSSDKIVLSAGIEKTAEYNVAVYDMSGRKVYEQQARYTAGNQTITLTGANLSSGMYIVNMNNGENRGTAKFTIQ